MYKLNKKTIKKAVLISLIGEYRKVLFGSTRLQKVLYFTQRDQTEKPFTFKKYFHGQYSEEVDTQIEEIRDLKIASVRLCGDQLKIYKITNSETLQKAHTILKEIYPNLFYSIVENVNKYGYLPEEDLLDKAYGLKEMQEAEIGDTLSEDNIPEYIEIDEKIDPGMLEDFESSLNLNFVNPLIKLVNGLETIALSSEMEKKLFSVR